MDEATARYYQALNLEPSASADEIYQAYRDLVRVWDPQRFANSPRLELKAEEKLNEIIAAYHALEQLRARGGESASEVLVNAGGPPAPAREGRLPVADLHRTPAAPFSAAPQPAAVQTEAPGSGLNGAVAAPQPAAVQTEAPGSGLNGAVVEQPPSAAPRPATAQTEAPGSGLNGAPAAAPIADLHRTPEPAFSAAVRSARPPSGSNGVFTEQPIAELRRGSEDLFSAAPRPSAARPETPTSESGAAPEPTAWFTPNLPTALEPVTQSATATDASQAVPESTPASLLQQAAQSRNVRFAVAGAGFLLILAVIFFLFSALSGPAPSRGKGQESSAARSLPPDLVPAELPAHGSEARPGVSATEPAETARAPRRKRQAAPQPEEAPRQVPTGTELMAPEGKAGVGKFRIINQSGEDAVARLSSQDATSVALRLVYIQTGTEVNLGGIGTGVYYVTFSMGPLTSKPRTFGRQFGPFQFMQIQSASGYESDQYQISLKPRK